MRIAGYVSLGLREMYRCHHRSIIVCAAHLSGHPFAPCVVVGLLQHPAAPPSSALSWPPRRRRRGRRQRGRRRPGDGEEDVRKEDEPPEEPPKPAKKQKGGEGRRELLWLLWHLRHLPRHLHVRQLPMRPPPRAHPSTCTCRDRDTFLECIPMYTICIANVNPVCDVSEG